MKPLPLSNSQANAICRHGLTTAYRAYALNRRDGEGARTVGIYLGVSTTTANTLINAVDRLIALGQVSRESLIGR